MIDVSDPNSHGPEPSAKERRSHRKQKLETRKRYLAHHLHQTWDEKSRAKDQWNIPRLRRDWRSEMQEEQDQVKAELKEMGWRARFKQLGTTAVAATLLDMPKLRPPEPAPVETIGPSPEELSARRRAATGRKYIEAAFSPSFASAWYELHDGSLTGPALEGAKDILRSWVKTSLHIQAKQQPSDETVNRAVQQYFNSDPGTYIQREVATNLSHVRQSTRRMQRAPLDRPGLSDVTSVRVDYSIATQEWKSERHRIAQNLLSLADKHAKLTGEELPASVIYAAVGQDILELELQLGTITLRPEALVRATTSHPRLYGGMPESELEAGEEILQVESDAGRTIPTIDDRFERLTAVKDLMYHVQFLKDHPVFGVHQAETAALESRIHDFRELHGLVSKAGSGH